MKVKDAIKKLQKINPDAELVVELDEFPTHCVPVIDFTNEKMVLDTKDECFAEGTLQYLEHCKEKVDPSDIKNVVVCDTYEDTRY